MSDSSVPKARSSTAQNWLQRLADSNHALWLLFFMSFMESIIVPIPLELILIPFMIMERQRLWLIASVVLAGCLLGAFVGYSFGLWFFDSAGQWLVDALGASDQFEQFKQTLQADGFWAVLVVGVTPVPFQVAMIGAGAADYPLPMFMLAAAIARGIRYYGLALLVLAFGNYAAKLWDKGAAWVGISLLLIAFSVWFALQFI